MRIYIYIYMINITDPPVIDILQYVWMYLVAFVRVASVGWVTRVACVRIHVSYNNILRNIPSGFHSNYIPIRIQMYGN